MKKALALIFLHLYVISVFGITIDLHACCTHEKELPSCEHQQAPQVCEQHMITNHLTGDLLTCCGDCEPLAIEITPDQSFESTHLNYTVSADPLWLLPFSMTRLWVAPAIPHPLTLTPANLGEDPVTAEDTPIFIQNCTYRL